MMKKAITTLAACFLCLSVGACAPGTGADYTKTAHVAASDTPVASSPPESPGAEAAHDVLRPDAAAEASAAKPTGDEASHTATASPSPDTAASAPAPSDDDFVRVLDYIPSVCVDLKYASEDNFTGQVIYDFCGAYLRYGTVKKLAAVQERLAGEGFGLKIWDAFRPVSSQFKLWEVCPDPAYVANPKKGFSSHSKGNTVDVTLVTEDGSEVQMPTGFDDFSDLADRDYSDAGSDAAANARRLEKAMLEGGFSGYSKEWWHFSDTTSYPVDKTFSPDT